MIGDCEQNLGSKRSKDRHWCQLELLNPDAADSNFENNIDTDLVNEIMASAADFDWIIYLKTFGCLREF